MKQYLSFAVVIVLTLLLVSSHSTAQTPLKMRLMTESGDMITSNVSAIKSYFMAGDGTLTITLQDPLTFAPTDPPISVGTALNCTLPGDGSVRAWEGSAFSFNVNSTDSGATLSAPVRPYNSAGAQGTFNLTSSNSGDFQWSTGLGDAGTYLAVFQAVNGAKSSQIVVMIKINPAETVTVPTTISGPSTGMVGASYAFTASGSTSSLTHAVEYQFDWGDGSVSGWSSSSQSHAWVTASATAYNIKAKARCVSDQVESGWSSSRPITISNAPPPTYTLVVNTYRAKYGSVTLSPPGGSYSAGTQVKLTAKPAGLRIFTGWSGDATGTITGTTNPITITMPSSNVTVTAIFE
jgi:uncharacterized repeat protein (TIGR02543 family)